MAVPVSYFHTIFEVRTSAEEHRIRVVVFSQIIGPGHKGEMWYVHGQREREELLVGFAMPRQVVPAASGR